eukprot:13409994-Alexandrium_andersonii.AAC.1
MRQGRAVVSLETERPDMRERALLAAEAAQTANEEESELDGADYVDLEVDDEVSCRSQEGWSAYADGTQTGSRDSAGSGGPGPSVRT